MQLKTKAFTLIELMVAISILALMAVSLLTAYTSCLLLSSLNNNLVRAANDAQFVLEELSGLSYDDIDSYVVPDFDNLKDQVVTIGITGGAGKKSVVVEVAWDQAGRDSNFKLFTVFHE